MISDVLSECVHEIDEYLNSSIFDDVYKGEIRDRIIRLRNEAEHLRCVLDVPASVQLPPESVLLERIDAQRTLKVEDRRYLLASDSEALELASAKL